MPALNLFITKTADDVARITYNAIIVAAALADVDVNPQEVSSTELAKIAPFGILPGLETSAGIISGASALSYVVSLDRNTPLLGESPLEQAKIANYVSLVPLLVEQTAALDAKGTENDKINSLKKLVATVKPINQSLIATTFLTGHIITIADIALALALKKAFAGLFGPKTRKELPALTRWYTTVVAQKVFIKRWPEVVIQDKDVFLMPDLVKLSEAKVEKKVNPLDKLPKSTMVLDDIKRLYCQARPFNPNFGAEFWPIFDAEGWCCVEADFMYKDDFTQLHMCENGVAGFSGRADSTKRYSFGCLNIYKEGDYYLIKGAFLFRGTEGVPQIMLDVSDAEEYTWTKIDVSTEEGKKRFIDLFCAEKVDGHEVIARELIK